MSEANPYAPTGNVSAQPSTVRKVEVHPIELFKRAYAMMGDQYWLFVGITLVGILIGSAVPLGILMGPIMVGIYLCFLHREAGQQVEFATLFKGFDQFKDAFIAFLIMLAVSMGVMLVFGVVFVVVMLGLSTVMQGQGGGGGLPVAGLAVILVMYVLLLFACVAVYIPFIFAFQLIADRRLSGTDAVKLSWQGVKINLGGVITFMIVNMLISIVAALLCYFPAFLFMPISFGALFLLYRDIFGASQHAVPPPTQAPVVS